MKAIDLYAGIGGWSAGLVCAGIEVVGAYEIWPAAIRTYNANLGTSHSTTDVRKLDPSELPKGISLVVGSPPCTEFSLSNRGGGGDITEGLKDIVRFLEIVDRIKPTYWLMENVPRIANMVREGLKDEDHPLFAYRHLAPQVRVVDFAEFGLPQSRARCLVGAFPFDLLDSFKRGCRRMNLGNVISALSGVATVIDPIWQIELERGQLTEMEPEAPLDGEQLRMNREAKRFHPVYNEMPFPDPLDQPSRTVTATCTRVSRESIVVDADETLSLRRLTIRERATLQGFPITYQFYGNSHSQKAKLIGNAVPPYFAYLVGAAAQQWASAGLDRIPADTRRLALPDTLPHVTPPHAKGTAYPTRRRFRAALPSLRFKSGMRFQLSNHHPPEGVTWTVEFFFGPSKAVRTVKLDADLFERLATDSAIDAIIRKCRPQLEPVKDAVMQLSAAALQESWRQCSGGFRPYDLVDLLGHAAIALSSGLTSVPRGRVIEEVLRACSDADGKIASERKLSQNAVPILAGLVLGSWFNCLSWADAQATEGSGAAFAAG